jgi:hypothetical protein
MIRQVKSTERRTGTSRARVLPETCRAGGLTLGLVCGVPNKNAHQLRALEPAPAQTCASLAAPLEGAARPAARAHSARRLHARG